MASPSSPVPLVLVGLDVVVPAEGVAQVCWGRGRDDFKDRHISLRGNVPEDRGGHIACSCCTTKPLQTSWFTGP